MTSMPGEPIRCRRPGWYGVLFPDGTGWKWQLMRELGASDRSDPFPGAIEAVPGTVVKWGYSATEGSEHVLRVTEPSTVVAATGWTITKWGARMEVRKVCRKYAKAYARAKP